MKVIREAVKWVVPHNIWNILRQKKRDRLKRRQLALAGQMGGGKPDKFTHREAVKWLVSTGCQQSEVEAGSMPPGSLDYAWSLIAPHLPAGPVRGLHIGNFVGVSLAFFTHAAAKHHADSFIVSIDPNIPHRGIENPMQKVIGLLEHFGLENNSVLLSGYSLEKNYANDGLNYETGEARSTNLYAAQPSCTRQLRHLLALCPGRFDFAMIDGNHDGDYLSGELVIINQLLRPEGMLLLDDVGDGWFEIEQIYDKIDQRLYRKLGADGRVGLLQKLK